jgi:hypothetical protein
VDSKVSFGSLRDGATWIDYPCYKGGLPEELFYPIHYMDKTYFRPTKWKYVVHEIKPVDISDEELEKLLDSNKNIKDDEKASSDGLQPPQS